MRRPEREAAFAGANAPPIPIDPIVIQPDAPNADVRPTAAPMLRRHSRRGPRGFVLVAMVWSLGLITILASFGIVGARFRERATADSVAEAKAAAAAEAGLSLGIARALLQAPGAAAAPWRCVLPGGQHLAIATADESGKVDLNATPLAGLTTLFSNLTQDRDAGARIAAAVVVFRAALRDSADDALMRRYASDNKPEGPKRAPFVTTLELDQVVGVSHALFEAALPFVTVRTQSPDVDFSRATPAMRRLFGVGDVNPTARVAQTVREVTITADATTSDGARFVRQALVTLGGVGSGGAEAPYTIHEWRRADRGLPAADAMSDDDAGAEGSCFSAFGRS